MRAISASLSPRREANAERLSCGTTAVENGTPPCPPREVGTAGVACEAMVARGASTLALRPGMHCDEFADLDLGASSECLDALCQPLGRL